MRQMQIEFGHPQPHTPMQTDNAAAHVQLTNKNLPKALKAMDMRFHWLRCRDAQGQFRYHWWPGMQNLADYFTKHHPATHHKSVCPTILPADNDPEYRKLFMTQDASSPHQRQWCKDKCTKQVVRGGTFKSHAQRFDKMQCFDGMQCSMCCVQDSMQKQGGTCLLQTPLGIVMAYTVKIYSPPQCYFIWMPSCVLCCWVPSWQWWKHQISRKRSSKSYYLSSWRNNTVSPLWTK